MSEKTVLTQPHHTNSLKKNDDEKLQELGQLLTYGQGSSRLLDIAKTLLCLDFVTTAVTDVGNEDLRGTETYALMGLVRKCAFNIVNISKFHPEIE